MALFRFRQEMAVHSFSRSSGDHSVDYRILSCGHRNVYSNCWTIRCNIKSRCGDWHFVLNFHSVYLQLHCEYLTVVHFTCIDILCFFLPSDPANWSLASSKTVPDALRCRLRSDTYQFRHTHRFSIS